MSRILLNNTILYEIENSKYKSILLNKNYQKNTINYYFIPTIGITLYNPKVSWIDPLKKHISFSFYKYPELKGTNNYTSLNLIKKCNDVLGNIYKNYEYDNNEKQVAPFFYEKGDYYYIRCYLPKSKVFYNIISQYDDENITTLFKIPSKETIYNNITIEFRNIWEDISNSLVGFNIELKEVRI